eukprot:509755-Amphidinium_carterae.1
MREKLWGKVSYFSLGAVEKSRDGDTVTERIKVLACSLRPRMSPWHCGFWEGLVCPNSDRQRMWQRLIGRSPLTRLTGPTWVPAHPAWDFIVAVHGRGERACRMGMARQ